MSVKLLIVFDGKLDYEIKKTLDENVLVSTGHDYNDGIYYHKC